MQNSIILDQLGIASALGVGLGFPVGTYGGIIAAAKLINLFPSVEPTHALFYTASVTGAAAGMTVGALAPLALRRLVCFTVGSFRKLSVTIRGHLENGDEMAVRQLTEEQRALVTKLKQIDLASTGHAASSVIVLDLDSGVTTILPRGSMSTIRRKAMRMIEMMWPAGSRDDASAPKFMVFENGIGRRSSADEAFELMRDAQRQPLLPFEVEDTSRECFEQQTFRP